MKKISRTTKRWTALILAFIMLFQPAMTAFAQNTDDRTRSYAEAELSEEFTEEAASEQEDSGEAVGEVTEPEAEIPEIGTATESEAEDPEAEDPETGAAVAADLTGSGGGGGGTASFTISEFNRDRLPVYLGTEIDEEYRVEGGGTFEYPEYVEGEDWKQELTVCWISTGHQLYGVYIQGKEDGAEEYRINSGEVELHGVTIEYEENWKHTVTVDLCDYPEGFVLELITEPIPDDGEFRIHMDEEYDRDPKVYYMRSDDSRLRVRNDSQGAYTYQYTPGQTQHTFIINSPLDDGTVYAAEITLRQNGKKIQEIFPSQEEGSPFKRLDDGSYELILFGDKFLFPEMITGGVYLDIFWTEDDYRYHHFEVGPEERRVEVYQKNGDRDECALILQNANEGHHAFCGEVYRIDDDQELIFEVCEGGGCRFDHVDVYDEPEGDFWKTYYRSDIEDGTITVVLEGGETLPAVVNVDHYYEEIPECEGFLLDDAVIEGPAHGVFEQELVLRLKDGYSWNTEILDDLETGTDLGCYIWINRRNVRDHDGVQDGDLAVIRYAGIDTNDALHLTVEGKVISGYSNLIELKTENLVLAGGEPYDGFVRNKRNDRAYWNIEPLRKMTILMEEEDLPVRPDDDGTVSGQAELVLDQGYRFAEDLEAGDVSKCVGINLEDDCQTVTVTAVTDGGQAGDRRKVSLSFEGTSFCSRDEKIEFYFWDCIERYDNQTETWNLIDGEVKTKFSKSIRWDIPTGVVPVSGSDVFAECDEEVEVEYTLTLAEDSPWDWDIKGLLSLQEDNNLTGHHFELTGFDGCYYFDSFSIDENDPKKLTLSGTVSSGQDWDIPVEFRVRDVFIWAEGQEEEGSHVSGAELFGKNYEDIRIIIGDPYRFKVTCAEDSFEIWQGSKDDENRIETDQDYSFDPESESLQIILRKKEGRDPVFRGYYLRQNGGNTELITLSDERFIVNEEDREYTLSLDPGEYRNGFRLEVINYELPYNGEFVPDFDDQAMTIVWEGTERGGETTVQKTLENGQKYFFEPGKAQTLTVTPDDPGDFYGLSVDYPEASGEENFELIKGETDRIVPEGGGYTVTLFEEQDKPETGFWITVYRNQEEFEYCHIYDAWNRKYREDYYYFQMRQHGDTSLGSVELITEDMTDEEYGLRRVWDNCRGVISRKDSENNPRTQLKFRVEMGKFCDADIWINGERFDDSNAADGILTYDIPADTDEIYVDYTIEEKNTQWLFRIEDTFVTGTALTELEGQSLYLTIPEEDETHVWKAGMTKNQDLSAISEVEDNSERQEFTLKFKEYLDGETRKRIRVGIVGYPTNGNGDELRLVLKDLINEIKQEGDTTVEEPMKDQIRNIGNSNARWNIANFRKITIEGPEEGFTVERDADGIVRHSFTLTLDEGFRWIDQASLQSMIDDGHVICSNLLDELPNEAERTETITVTSMREDRRSITFSLVGETNYEVADVIRFYCWDCVEKQNGENWSLIMGEVSNYRNEKIRFNIPVMENMTLAGDGIFAGCDEYAQFSYALTLDEELGWTWDEERLSALKEDSNLYDCFSFENYRGEYILRDCEVNGRTLTLSGKLRSGAAQDIPARIRANNIFKKDGVRVYGELLSEENSVRIVTGSSRRFEIFGYDDSQYALWKGTEQTDENRINKDGEILNYSVTAEGFAGQKFTLKQKSQDAVFEGIYLYPDNGGARYCVTGASIEGASVVAKGNGVFEITVDPNKYPLGVKINLITWVFPRAGELVPQFDDGKFEDEMVFWTGKQNGEEVTLPLHSLEKVHFDAGSVQTLTVKADEYDENFFYGIDIRYPEGHDGNPGFISRDEFVYDETAKVWTYELFSADRQPAAGFTLDVYWFEQEYNYEHMTDDFDRDAYYLVERAYDEYGSGSGYFAPDVNQYAAFGSRYGQDRYKISKSLVPDGIPFSIYAYEFSVIKDLWINGLDRKGGIENDRIVYLPGDGEWRISATVKFEEYWFGNCPQVFEFGDGKEGVVISGTAGTFLSQEVTLTIREDKPDLVWAPDLENGDHLSAKFNSNSDRHSFICLFVRYNDAEHKSITVRVQGTPACGYDMTLQLMVKDLIYKKNGEGQLEKAETYYSSTDDRQRGRWAIDNLRILTIEAEEDGFTVSRDASGYLEHDFTLTLADGYRFAEDITAEEAANKLSPNEAGWRYEITNAEISGNSLSFHFKGVRHIELQEPIQFYLWDCIEKQREGYWVLLGFEAATVINEKIRWSIPRRINLELDGETVTAERGQEKNFEYTLTIRDLDWKWSEKLLQEAGDHLEYQFELEGFPDQVWVDSYTYVSDKVIRIRGRVKSDRNLDIPAVICAQRFFVDANGEETWGNLYSAEKDDIRIVIGDPHQFEIQGFDGRFSAWKGTELTDENRIYGGNTVSYTEKEGGGFELQKFVLKSNSSDAVFRGVWVYPNNGNNEFYPIGSTEVRDLGEGLYEITLDPNRYRSGAKVRFFTNDLPYDGQFIPSFGTENDVSVRWTEGNKVIELEHDAYYNFTKELKQTFMVVMPEGQEFYGLEVFYADPGDGEYGFFVPRTDERFTYNEDENLWTIELFDGEDHKPVSGYWLEVYWSEEEYHWNHLEDEEGWWENSILAYVWTGAGDGTVTVEGQTGYLRFGTRKYMIPKADVAAGITIAVTPGEGNVLEELRIENEESSGEYSGDVVDGKLLYTYSGDSAYMDVEAKFKELRTDLGSHITVRDTRITAWAGDEYTAHLYLTLDEECGYTWAEEEPEGTHPAIRLNKDENDEDAEIIFWEVDSENPRLLEVKMAGVCNSSRSGNKIEVSVIRGLLDKNGQAVTGKLTSVENSNAKWNINTRSKAELSSGSCIDAVTGVMSEPAEFVLTLRDDCVWSDSIRTQIDNEHMIGAFIWNSNVEFVSVSGDRRSLTVRMAGKPAPFAGTQKEAIVFYIGPGCIVENGRSLSYSTQTEVNDGLFWNITQREGLKVSDVALTGAAGREYEKSLVLTLDESLDAYFDEGKLPQDPAELSNFISFNGNPFWWTFTGYELSDDRLSLTVEFLMNVPYRMEKEPLKVYVNNIISGVDFGMISEENENAYWYIRRRGMTMGLAGATGSTGLRSGESVTFEVDRDGYDGDIEVNWELLYGSRVFTLEAEGESATVTSENSYDEPDVLQAEILYDYDPVNEKYDGRIVLQEDLYTVRSFVYENLEEEVSVLEKGQTVHVSVLNPEDLEIRGVSWRVGLVAKEADWVEDTRITVAPTGDGEIKTEAVVKAEASTGNECAELAVEVTFIDIAGNETTESYCANINVFDGKENCFRVSYDAAGGSGIVSSQTVRAGESVTFRQISFLKDNAYAENWKDQYGTVYWPGEEFVPVSDLVLKANWEPKGWQTEDGNRVYYRNGEKVCNEWVTDGDKEIWLGEDGTAAPDTRVVQNDEIYCTDGGGAKKINGWAVDAGGREIRPMYLNGRGTAYGASGEEEAFIDGKYYSFSEGWALPDYEITLQADPENPDEEEDYILYLLDSNPAGQKLPKPENEEWRLEGWYTADGTKVTDADLKDMKESCTLYGRWTALKSVYVSYWEQSASNPSAYPFSGNDWIYGAVGETTAYEAPERPGFTARVEQQTIAETGTQVNVWYDRKTYQLSFNMEGSGFAPVSPASYTYGEPVSLPDDASYQKEGMTFLGWYMDGERLGDGENMPALDVVLTPCWAYGENWIFDGSGWKYTFRTDWNDDGTNQFVGLPETDPAVWYYLDDKGYMVQQDAAALEKGIAAFGADGQRISGSFVSRISWQKKSWYYAGEDGWFILGSDRTIGGKTYAFNMNGEMAFGLTDEGFNQLEGTGCVLGSMYYFSENEEAGTAGQMEKNYLYRYSGEIPDEYRSYDSIWFRFGADGRKVTGQTVKVDGMDCTFDLNGVLTSGVTVVYNYGGDSEWTMENSLIPAVPGMGGSICPNLYSRHGYYFGGWKGSDGKTYTDGQSLSAEEVEALYLAGGQLVLTAQWKPVCWKVELPELENAQIRLSEDSTRGTGTKVTVTIAPDAGYHLTETSPSALELTWYGEEKEDEDGKTIPVTLTKESANTWSFTMPASNVGIYAETEGDEGVKYTLEYWYQDTEGKYVRNDKQTKVMTDGIVGQPATLPDCDDVRGFYPHIAPEQTPVAADGSTVYKYQFPRQKLELRLSKDGGIGSVTGAKDAVYFDKEVTVSAVPKTGYHFVRWTWNETEKSTSASYTFRMPAEEDIAPEEGEQENAAPAGCYELTAESAINTYTVTFNKNSSDATGSTADQDFVYGTAAELRTNGYSRKGYVFAGWVTEPGRTTADYTDGQSVINLTAVHNGTVTLYALWEAGESTTYKVEHYKQDLADEGYTLADTDSRTGKTDSNVTPAVKDYSGFTAPQTQTVKIKADGSLTVKYYYTRNSYQLTLVKGTGIAEVTGAGTYKFETDVPVTAAVKTGYTFSNWTKGETVLSENTGITYRMTAEAAELKANATANTYSVKYNANTGSGEMAVQSFTYDESKALTANAFTKTGYHFTGWAESAGGAVKYADQVSVKNLTAEDGKQIELFAKWEANTYSVKFNANGGSGSMANETFTYDAEEKELTANAFTKTGYHFTGWAETAGGAVKYADKASVKNLTAENGGKVELFAKWEANSYSVKFNANTGSGEMADMSFTYDEEKTLTANAFTKTGYHFAGWALTAGGAVKYADQANVKNLTAEDGKQIELFAKWEANTCNVKFNANGGSGSMANETFTYDAEAKELTANAFTKTGYHFTGWAESAGGAVKYADKASVKNLTAENGKQIELFAKWEANTYSVKFNANGGSGSMANESFTYDAEAKALTANAFTKTGYHFTGWAETAGGAVKYVDKAAVRNLTAQADGVVNLYAVWAANSYSVKFNAGGGSGEMAAQSFTYDVQKTLTANAFTKTGYHFTGWAESAGGAVKYADQASVKNLTAEDGKQIELFAKWEANSYSVKFNANGGSGTMANETFTYDAEAKALTANAFTKTGYTFAGWAESAGGAVKYADQASVRNLTAQAGAVVNLYAVWTANSYSVKFNAGGGSGSMENEPFIYGAPSKALTPNAFTKTGYHFAGWSVTAGGAVKYADKAAVSNLTAQADGVVNLYAVWTANTYSVKFNANGGSGSMANESFTYDAEAKALTANAYTRTGYTFAGWAESAGGAVKYADQASVRNLTAQAGAVVNLYAVWTANSYSVKFNANTGTGTMANETFIYGAAAKTLTANAFTKTGYHFTGWAETAGGAVKYADREAVSNLTAQAGAVVNLYAVWAANTWKVNFNAGGGTGTMADESFVYDTERALTALGFRKQGYTFKKWTVDEAGTDTGYMNRQKVKNLKSENGAVLKLYAQWTPNEDTAYTVVHRLQNLAGNAYVTERTEGRYGTTDTLTTAKAKNFEGFTAQTITQKNISADGTTSVEVRYDRKSYDVIFVTEQGTAPAAESVRYEGTVQKPADPEAVNYTFAGWYADEKFRTEWDFDEDVITEPTMIYAKWIARKKHLIFDAGEGTVSPSSKDVDFKGTYQDLPVPVRTGYGFSGWYTEEEAGELVNNLTPVTDTVTQTLYAHWESGKYTVSFRAGEGRVTGGSDSKLVEYDSTYGALPAAVREGYQFLGWFTSGTGGTQIKPETTVKITEDQILYALYTAVNYPITYNGLGGADNQNPDHYTINDEFFFKKPVRNDYLFAGWDMQINGEPMGEKMMMAGIEEGTTGAVTMTANWTEYVPQENSLSKNSKVIQKGDENEGVQNVLTELSNNAAAETKTENLEKAIDAEKLKELAEQEVEEGKEVKSVEVRLEIKLEDVQVEEGDAAKTTLSFEITPLAVFKDATETVIAENVPISDDVLNKEERFTFRLPVPDSITASYAKVKHTTTGGTVVNSIHQILTSADGKYILYNADELSPFEMSFSNTSYVIDDIAKQYYTGSAICPAVTVREEGTGTVLVKDADYSLTYVNNVEVTTAASRAKAVVTILASGLRIEKEFTIEKKSSGGGGGGGGGGTGGGGSSGGGPGGSGSSKVPSWVEKNGTWKLDAAGSWTYTNNGELYRNKWGCIYNPYANTAAGQRAYDWFRFDANGNMLTGWFTDTDGNVYYLNPVSDGSKGRMVTGWQQIDGNWYYFSNAEGSGTMGALLRNTTTPDGYKVDARGVWIR